jgi:hypothetical protein
MQNTAMVLKRRQAPHLLCVVCCVLLLGRKDLFKPLRVHFIGEEGIDAGGVKKEFFQLLVGELLSPDYGMLVYQPESHTYW